MILFLIYTFFYEMIYFIDCIVVIPFKTYEPIEPKNFTMKTVLESLRKNIIYATAYIGTPAQKINIGINSQTFAIELFQNMCDIPISKYNNSLSSTFNKKQSITYYPMIRASIIDETVYFYNDTKMEKLKPYKLLNLIYSDNKKEDQSYLYEYHNYTCINIGLQMKEKSEIEKNINIINQLVMNHKESHDFSFKYTSDKEGIIIIGALPHIYEPDKYLEQYYRKDGAVDPEIQNYRDWHLNFDEIYISYKNKTSNIIINKKLNETNKIRLFFDFGIIYGSSDYYREIKNIFFQDLIDKNICWEEKINFEIGFYCQKNKAEEIIKNEFPSLNFKMSKFENIFELTYEDLFLEKNNILYFLVFFADGSHRKYFEVGKIFLKKYFFTFNQDAKLIGYYTKIKNSESESHSFFTFDATFIVFILLLITIFITIGFLCGKLIYDKFRKRRKNELDDLFEYKPKEENEPMN